MNALPEKTVNINTKQCFFLTLNNFEKLASVRGDGRDKGGRLGGI